MSEPSIFTRIINGEIPSDIVYEDDLVVAFRDIEPQAPHHYLIVPREPLKDVSAITPETEHIAGRLIRVAGDIARKEGVENGFRLVINEGKDGGQLVMHIHVHLMGGREMGWPPG